MATMVKEEYVHDVVERRVYRDFSGNRKEDQIVLRGTADQIAKAVAESVKSQLKSGKCDVIRLEPIAPYNIFDLEKN